MFATDVFSLYRKLCLISKQTHLVKIIEKYQELQRHARVSTYFRAQMYDVSSCEFYVTSFY